MAVSKPLKYLVFVFNLLFVIFGFILLGIGIWGEVTNKNYAKYEVVKEYEVTSGPRLLIAVAVIIIVIAFFGCCGAHRESKCLLCSFVIALSVLLILEIAAAALAYKHKDEVKAAIEKAIKKKMNEYKTNDPVKDLDQLQRELKCCGVLSYKDWENATNFKDSDDVPRSCCMTDEPKCGEDKVKSGEGIYKEGCLSKLKDYFDKNDKVLAATGGIAIAILVIQILGIVFGLVLFCQIRKNQDSQQIK